tara:strand:+ start:166 stop:405 length:240 start_codon:yes stop_codon:yes gene_type:complete
MGFNKRYINKDRIISSFKYDGAKGVTDLYRADAVILEGRCSICHYIDKIMNKNKTIEYKHNLIEIYMSQLLEGLYTSKI